MSSPAAAEALSCLLSPGQSVRSSGPFGARSSGTGSVYVVVPGTRGGLLVPVAPPRCTAAGITAHSAASGALARWGVRALSVMSRTGVARLAPRQVLLGAPELTILGDVEELFGVPVVAAVHLGPPRANRKPVLHVMDQTGRTLAFVKVGVNDLTDARVRAETGNLRLVDAHQPPGLLVPRLRAAGKWRGHAYAVLEPVPTGPGPSTVPIGAVGRLAGAFPVSRHDPVQTDWWLKARGSLDVGDGGTPVSRLRLAGDRIAAIAPPGGVTTGATHGDFTPWNCFEGPGGVSVWDWERFATDRPLGWDALHYAASLALRRGSARSSTVRTVRRDAPDLVEANGGDRGSGLWTYAAYLWHRGVSFVRDGQLTAGASRAVLEAWLLPELEAVLAEDLAGRP